jgi:hypothetical protein
MYVGEDVTRLEVTIPMMMIMLLLLLLPPLPLR